MKKMLFICLTLLLASCQEPYEKAIDKYYKSHLDDPGSYELIEMGKPQKLTPTSYLAFTDGDRKDFHDFVMKFRDSYKKEGKDPDEHIGYIVEHEYRATNRCGAKVKHFDRIHLDKELKQVIVVEPIK